MGCLMLFENNNKDSSSLLAELTADTVYRIHLVNDSRIRFLRMYLPYASL